MDPEEFYGNYKGHKLNHLEKIYNHFISKNPNQKFIYLAGDSSLDNKFWILTEKSPAPNSHKDFFNPQIMVQDIAYHINNLTKNDEYVAINCAVEASTLGERVSTNNNNLLEQDVFIRNHIKGDDILIVSCGGNDLALMPSLTTIFNMFKILITNLSEISPETSGMPHFIEIFKHFTEKYIKSLTMKNKPSKVLVCGMYFPDENQTNSWANTSLQLLNYNKNPVKIQNIIGALFKFATSNIKVSNINIVPVPMFKVLDGKNTQDYDNRVEPSVIGGKKLCSLFLKMAKIQK